MKRYLLILALCGSVHADDDLNERARQAAFHAAMASSYVEAHEEHAHDVVIDFWGTANDPQAQANRRRAEAFSESVRQDDIIRRLKEIEKRQEEILRRER